MSVLPRGFGWRGGLSMLPTGEEDCQPADTGSVGLAKVTEGLSSSHPRRWICERDRGTGTGERPSKGTGRGPACHDLRHTAAYLRLARGVDRVTVKTWCHASISTTNLYLHHLGPSADRTCMAQLNYRGRTECPGGLLPRVLFAGNLGVSLALRLRWVELRGFEPLTFSLRRLDGWPAHQGEGAHAPHDAAPEANSFSCGAPMGRTVRARAGRPPTRQTLVRWNDSRAGVDDALTQLTELDVLLPRMRFRI